MTYESWINGLEEALNLAKNKNEQVKILKAEVERLNGVVAELEQAKSDAEIQHQAEVDALNAKIDELKKILATD